MKLWLLVMLMVVVLAGYLGTLIARDPGYVLISYRDYAMQTSLWVMLGFILVFALGVYLLLRLWRLLRSGGGMFQGWQAGRRERRAKQLSEKGLMLLAEGEFERARRFLDSSVLGDESDGIHYLAVARAANDAGDDAGRKKYLKLAEESNRELARAASVVGAELALMRGDADAALRTLDGVKVNGHVAALIGRALRRQGDWREMLRRLPELKKAGKAQGLEKEAAIMGLNRWQDDNGALNELFKSLSAEARQDADVIAAYARNLSDKSHAEPVLRSAINRSWQPELVALYGLSDQQTLATRNRHAGKWRKEHPQDAALLYCIGCLHLAGGDHRLAREALQPALELGFADARARLAETFAADGDYQRAYDFARGA